MVERPIDERRSSVRAKRIITVRHRLHKRGRITPAERRWHISVTENMSSTGLLFQSGIDYQPKDIVEVQVVMSGVLDIFNGFGEVVRSQEKTKAKTYFVAIHYVDLKPKRRSAKAIASSATKKKTPVKKKKK